MRLIREHPRRRRLQEPETRFMEAVRELAQWNRYLTYHTLRSTGSEPGFLDLVMARAGRPLLMIETKSQTGRVTVEQRQWLDVLPQTTGIRVEVWRPDMWAHIEALLQHGMP